MLKCRQGGVESAAHRISGGHNQGVIAFAAQNDVTYIRQIKQIWSFLFACCRKIPCTNSIDLPEAVSGSGVQCALRRTPLVDGNARASKRTGDTRKVGAGALHFPVRWILRYPVRSVWSDLSNARHWHKKQSQCSVARGEALG